MTPLQQRTELLEQVAQANKAGVSRLRCAQELGISSRTLARWQQDISGSKTGDKRPSAKKSDSAS